eukprot:TRINITY_DN12022_c0_g1_i1.p1 TRINITY_DN12022_c0_g1~~TRINITY_DN12022_c0_g1_i1.p1  ORF type:complete len:270 (-),score=77.44 TRINITY_DN12022_c0_g1_i1:76-885(-)
MQQRTTSSTRHRRQPLVVEDVSGDAPAPAATAASSARSAPRVDEAGAAATAREHRRTPRGDSFFGGSHRDPFANDPFFAPRASGASSLFPRSLFEDDLFFGDMGMGMNWDVGRFMRDADVAAAAGDGTSYSYSSYCSSSTSGDGSAPVVYEATKTKQAGPGGVVEEQRTERDSRSGVQKMEIHRKLMERSRRIEQRRVADGPVETKEELRGVEAGKGTEFDHDWQQAASRSLLLEPASHTLQQRRLRHEPHAALRLSGPAATDKHKAKL